MFAGGKETTGVLVYDGARWIAGVGDGEDDIREGSLAMLPGELLDRLRERGAASLRMVVPADFRQIVLRLPADVSRDEMQAALAWETAGSVGVDPGGILAAASFSTVYGMGGARDAILAAPFDRRDVRSWNDACEGAGLEFEGVGALQAGFLAAHAAAGHTEEWLLHCRSDSTLAVMPAHGETPFMARNIPLGRPPEEGADEWMNAMARRLKAMAGARARLIVDGGDPGATAERFSQAVGGADIDACTVADMIPGVMQAAAEATPGSPDSPLPLVNATLRLRDPHTTGTWLMLAVIVIAALGIGGHWLWMKNAVAVAEETIAKGDAVKKQRASVREQIARVGNEISKERKFQALLQNRDRIQSPVIEVLELLSRKMPRYSRVTSLQETRTKDKRGRIVDALVLEGRMMPRMPMREFADLSQTLQDGLADEGVTVEPVGVSEHEGRGDAPAERRFEIRLIYQ